MRLIICSSVARVLHRSGEHGHESLAQLTLRGAMNGNFVMRVKLSDERGHGLLEQWNSNGRRREKN